MYSSIHLLNCYQRLNSLYDKTVHFHGILVRLIDRMGVYRELITYLTWEVRNKKRFADELHLLIKNHLRPEIDGPYYLRPVARFWVSGNELFNVTCTAEVKSSIRSANLMAFREYGYLAQLPFLPSAVEKMAGEHRRVLGTSVSGILDKGAHALFNGERSKNEIDLEI